MSTSRLLVIEDDKNIADLIHHVGVEMGFDVCAACDFAGITSLYDRFVPDVIVLDILMPGMDGFEVLHFLRRRNSTSRVIILSGQPDYRSMAKRMGEGLELTITATVAKPFRITELREVLHAVLEKTKLSMETAALPPQDSAEEKRGGD